MHVAPVTWSEAQIMLLVARAVWFVTWVSRLPSFGACKLTFLVFSNPALIFLPRFPHRLPSFLSPSPSFPLSSLSSFLLSSSLSFIHSLIHSFIPHHSPPISIHRSPGCRSLCQQPQITTAHTIHSVCVCVCAHACTTVTATQLHWELAVRTTPCPLCTCNPSLPFASSPCWCFRALCPRPCRDQMVSIQLTPCARNTILTRRSDHPTGI